MDEMIINDLCNAGLAGKDAERGEERWVKIWVRDKFCCVYCDKFLLDDIVHMLSAQIDHLLPKWKHKTLASIESNQVLACFCCNQLKRKFDPLDYVCKSEGKHLTPHEALEKHRDKLINACKIYLAPRRKMKEDIQSRSIHVLKRHNHKIP